MNSTMRLLCHSLALMSSALFFVSVPSAHAQTTTMSGRLQGAIGFALPVYVNHEFSTGQDESDSGVRKAIGL